MSVSDAAGAGPTLLAVLLALAAAPVAADAQEEPGDPGMATAPAQFRVGVTGSHLGWSGGDRPRPDDGGLWGLELERLLLPAAAIRLEASQGTTTLVSSDDAVDARAFLFAVTGVARLALDPLERVGLVPFGTLGIGSVVHDPDRDDLTTASQNTLTWGAGLEARPLGRAPNSRLAPAGLRIEWRRYQVELENVFDPADLTARTRHANRFSASLFWAF
jgi:opacity protein-like surface antigen